MNQANIILSKIATAKDREIISPIYFKMHQKLMWINR
jgi:hypothetical protein